VQSLLEANLTSVKKLASHPASLAVPSKVQRIRRHPLFKNITEGAAVALAKHCTEKYFEPNTCLLKQYAPAKHWLLPIQGTYKVFQSAASLSSKHSAVGIDDALDSGSGSSESHFRASMAAATSAADTAALRKTVSSDAIDVTNVTFHGTGVNQNTFRSDGSRMIADGGALNAPLGLEDALGAAGHLQGGGKCDGYRYSVHSPGYTHVSFIREFKIVDINS